MFSATLETGEKSTTGIAVLTLQIKKQREIHNTLQENTADKQ